MELWTGPHHNSKKRFSHEKFNRIINIYSPDHF